MKIIIAFVCCLISVMLAAPVASQTYPNKAVRVVVPYPPGGPTDIVARVLFQQVAEATGQQFLVDNRAGAGGNIGAEIVAKAPADGYTLLIGTTAHAINMSLFKNLNYDVQKDFVAVSLLTQGPLVLVAHPQFPANSVKELIELAKNPHNLPSEEELNKFNHYLLTTNYLDRDLIRIKDKNKINKRRGREKERKKKKGVR